MAGDPIIYTRAQEILAAIVAAFGTAGIALPARQQVKSGPSITTDCCLVEVRVPDIQLGLPGIPVSEPCVQPVTGTFVASIRREVPHMEGGPAGQPSIPSAAEITASAEVLLTDALLLVRTIRDIDFNGDCPMVTLQSASASPNSNIGGWDATIRVALT